MFCFRYRAVAHIAKQSFNQVQLIGIQILVDIPAQDCHYRRKIKTFHFFTSFCSISAQLAFNEQQTVFLYNSNTRTLLFDGKLVSHLNEIDDAANAQMELITKQMAKTQGITEALKAQDQMA